MRRILLTLFLIFSNVVNATNISFAWESQPDYPPGVTYEFQANECAQSGITGTTTTCNLVGSPGDPLHAQVRAISPDSGQWFDSAWTALDTVIPGVALLYTNPEAQTNLSVSRTGGVAVADPAFAELGTLDYRGAVSASSLSSTIANVAIGDIVFAVVQRDYISSITGVAATGFTFLQIASCDSAKAESPDFRTRLYIGVATSSASSRVVTASFSDSESWGAMFTVRYTPGSGLVSTTPLGVSYNPSGASGLVASSTTRGSASNNLTVASGKRALLIAMGTDWDYYRNHTSANGYAKRVDSDTFGNDTTTQWFYDRVVDAGTYGGTGSGQKFGDASGADQYMGALIALEINAGGSADLNPDFLMPATILQAVNTSNW